jgi:hypothetical protein
MANEYPECHAPEQLASGIRSVMRRNQAWQCIRQIPPPDARDLMIEASECPPGYDAPSGRLAISAIETLDEQDLPVADLPQLGMRHSDAALPR